MSCRTAAAGDDVTIASHAGLASNVAATVAVAHLPVRLSLMGKARPGEKGFQHLFLDFKF